MPKEAFFNLEKSKQDTILDAAIDEFAEHGFGKASTNRIVKQAGISKGSLFYYFDGKDDLYLHLIRGIVDQFMDEFRKNVQNWPADIFERLKIMTVSGLDLMIGDYRHFRLYMAITEPEAAEVLKKILTDSFANRMQQFFNWFSDIDTSDFKYPPETVLRLVSWLYSGIKLELAYQEQPENLEEFKSAFLKRLDTVIAILRNAVYTHNNQEDQDD